MSLLILGGAPQDAEFIPLGSLSTTAPESHGRGVSHGGVFVTGFTGTPDGSTQTFRLVAACPRNGGARHLRRGDGRLRALEDLGRTAGRSQDMVVYARFTVFPVTEPSLMGRALPGRSPMPTLPPASEQVKSSKPLVTASPGWNARPLRET